MALPFLVSNVTRRGQGGGGGGFSIPFLYNPSQDGASVDDWGKAHSTHKDNAWSFIDAFNDSSFYQPDPLSNPKTLKVTIDATSYASAAYKLPQALDLTQQDYEVHLWTHPATPLDGTQSHLDICIYDSSVANSCWTSGVILEANQYSGWSPNQWRFRNSTGGNHYEVSTGSRVGWSNCWCHHKIELVYSTMDIRWRMTRLWNGQLFLDSNLVGNANVESWYTSHFTKFDSIGILTDHDWVSYIGNLHLSAFGIWEHGDPSAPALTDGIPASV